MSQPAGMAGCGSVVNMTVAGGVFDGVDQVAEPEPVGRGQDRGRVVGVGAVEADDGVEVHDAAALHLGDLAEAEP